MFDYSFTTAGRTFLLTLAATFALLLTMWVSAAHASEGRCELLSSGVVMCDGAGWRMPDAPRGTVKHRPAVSIAHRVAAALAAHRLASVGGRVGTTEVVARLGAR